MIHQRGEIASAVKGDGSRTGLRSLPCDEADGLCICGVPISRGRERWIFLNAAVTSVCGTGCDRAPVQPHWHLQRSPPQPLVQSKETSRAQPSGSSTYETSQEQNPSFSPP